MKKNVKLVCLTLVINIIIFLCRLILFTVSTPPASWSIKSIISATKWHLDGNVPTKQWRVTNAQNANEVA